MQKLKIKKFICWNFSTPKKPKNKNYERNSKKSLNFQNFIKKLIDSKLLEIIQCEEMDIQEFNIILPTFEDVQISILLPPPKSQGNNLSIGTFIKFNDRHILLTGDAEKNTLELYLKQIFKKVFKIDYYKASHHGSGSEKDISSFQDLEISNIIVMGTNKMYLKKPRYMENLKYFDKKSKITSYFQ